MFKMRFFRRLLDVNDPLSIKRFLILVMAGHYFVGSILVFRVNKTFAMQALAEKYIDYDFIMIMIGVFGLTVESVYKLVIKKVAVAGNAVNNIANTISNSEESTPTQVKEGTETVVD